MPITERNDFAWNLQRLADYLPNPRSVEQFTSVLNDIHSGGSESLRREQYKFGLGYVQALKDAGLIAHEAEELRWMLMKFMRPSEKTAKY